MYKTILVHVDESARSVERTAVAAQLAVSYEAHLIGAAMTGLPAYLFPVGSPEAPMPPLGLPVAALRADANRALDLFEAAAGRAGAPSIERRCVDEEPGIGMSMQARYCDLLVISQSALDEYTPLLRADFPDYVVLNSPRPVLVLPVSAKVHELGGRVTVAWNGSPEAARAIASALPLLRKAHRVDVVIFDADSGGNLHGEEPGADLALYLARHGVHLQVSNRTAGRDEGLSLLEFALEMQSDLIVMGAYGHARFSEIMLGGMTRSVLTASSLPLWMAH